MNATTSTPMDAGKSGGDGRIGGPAKTGGGGAGGAGDADGRERRLLSCLTHVFGHDPTGAKEILDSVRTLARELFPEDADKAAQIDSALAAAGRIEDAAVLRAMARRIAASLLSARAARIPARLVMEAKALERREGPFRILLGAPADTRADFSSALAAALRWRLSKSLSFFHRRNTGLERSLPTPFLLSEDFAVRVEDVARDLILPKMLASPEVARIRSAHPWHRVDAEGFWAVAEESGMDRPLLEAWSRAWHGMRLVPTWKGEGKERRKVLKGTPDLLAVRERMGAGAPRFHLPGKFGNDEISVAAAILGDTFKRESLDGAWEKVFEAFSKGSFDDLAEGAGRGGGAGGDGGTERFRIFQEGHGEFMALLSHWCWPAAGIGFLDAYKEARGGAFLSSLLETPEAVAARAKEKEAGRSAAAKAGSAHDVGWGSFSVPSTDPAAGRLFGEKERVEPVLRIPERPAVHAQNPALHSGNPTPRAGGPVPHSGGPLPHSGGRGVVLAPGHQRPHTHRPNGR